MNNLTNLLTKKNLEILAVIAELELSVREVAEKADCSPSKAHSAIMLFKKHNIVQVQRKKNRLIVKPNRSNALYQKVKTLINIGRLLNSKGFKQLSKFGSVAVYGSYAQGIDDKDSDVDLFILTETKELQLRSLLRSLETQLGKQVNALIVTKRKLTDLEKDKEFYTRLKLTAVNLSGDVFG